jgi:hypothetical protein
MAGPAAGAAAAGAEAAMKVNEYARGLIGSPEDFNAIRKIVYDNGGHWQSELTAGLKNAIDDGTALYVGKREKRSSRGGRR